MKYFLFVIVVLIASCVKKNPSQKYIAGAGIKFWDLIDSTGDIRGCYSFSQKGECYYYLYTKNGNCNRERFYDGDNVHENSWELSNDSILRYRSYDRKILLINEDTILTKTNDIIVLLVKSKCQVDHIKK